MIFFVEKLFPCEDYKPYCKNYAQTGQCRDVYTQRYCRKSCDLCKGEKKKAKKLIIQAENIALKNSATHEKRRDCHCLLKTAVPQQATRLRPGKLRSHLFPRSSLILIPPKEGSE